MCKTFLVWILRHIARFNHVCQCMIRQLYGKYTTNRETSKVRAKQEKGTIARDERTNSTFDKNPRWTRSVTAKGKYEAELLLAIKFTPSISPRSHHEQVQRFLRVGHILCARCLSVCWIHTQGRAVVRPPLLEI